MDRAALVRAAARNHVGWMEGLARAVTGGAGGRYDRVRWMEVRGGEVWVPFPRRPSGPALDALLAWSRERDVGRIGVWATGLEPLDALEAGLAARGFGEGWRPHWMAIASADLTLSERDPRVEIVRSTTPTAGRCWRSAAGGSGTRWRASTASTRATRGRTG